MTDDASAFAPLESRAAASAGPAGGDRISLRDHVVEVEIGAFGEERGQTQRLRISVVAEVCGTGAGGADDVDSILSYDRITAAVGAAVAAGRVDLLETLAERIAAGVLAEPQAARVHVRVEKLDRGPGDLGVEIVRDGGAAGPRRFRIGTPLAAEEEGAQPPGGAAILCVTPAMRALPAAEGEARRRIALLALDQAAWAAGGRLGLPVVATRTELEHMAGQGRACVWAPARMLLDSGETPETGGDLATWLAAYGSMA
ncbi:dihydroneopterin aldolase [Wenxinia saemankumensis]|uniref:dihydroneopterin aldolase n=1 Tax=Wenxinia saemankumensis TaxID=1447782 RepID=A0A1M6GXR7_9RHOB|nr:dihydroneopterin aldolase [Wenxinia saemankumensis]SHJ14690.1 dihydroneopterin aldolase [Wenxinia saemankumensis]